MMINSEGLDLHHDGWFKMKVQTIHTGLCLYPENRDELSGVTSNTSSASDTSDDNLNNLKCMKSAEAWPRLIKLPQHQDRRHKRSDGTELIDLPKNLPLPRSPSTAWCHCGCAEGFSGSAMHFCVPFYWS